MPISLRLEDDWADIAVNAIIDDLNDRSGLGIDSLEEDIQEEIKQTWAGIIRENHNTALNSQEINDLYIARVVTSPVTDRLLAIIDRLTGDRYK